MPAWLISLLIKLAMAIGLPLLKSAFPSVGAQVWAIIEDILNHLKTTANPVQSVADIHAAVKSCTGVGCPADTVGDK